MSEYYDVEPPHPGSLPAREREKRAPRWVTAFLRALERTGKVRAAAEDAGIDFSTAYQRRKRHADFAERWAEALRKHGETRAEREAEEMGAMVQELRHAPSPSHRSAAGPSLSREGRGADADEISNGKLRRVGPGRWSPAKERMFLEELTWSASIRRACSAIGMSRQAVSRRRMKDPRLDAACEAAIEVGRRRLNGYLVEAGNNTFDPDELPIGDEHELPRVTIAEAIQIAKLGGGGRQAPAPEPIHDIEGARARIEETMRKLGHIEDEEALLAAGWSRDEAHDRLIPPGWVRAPDAPLAGPVPE